MYTIPQVAICLRGLKRMKPLYSRPRRLPITPSILQILYRSWSVTPVNYEQVMLWAACCLGFFAFLRAGELTSSSRQVCTLSPSDIATDSRRTPSYITITLRSSKTDPFGAGVMLHVGRTGQIICPVTSVLAYLAIRPSIPGPLFVHRDGTPLTRPQLVTAVHSALTRFGVQTAGFSGHSFSHLHCSCSWAP